MQTKKNQVGPSELDIQQAKPGHLFKYVVCSSSYTFGLIWLMVMTAHFLLILLSLFWVFFYGIVSYNNPSNALGFRARELSSFSYFWQVATALYMLLFSFVHLKILFRDCYVSVKNRRFMFHRRQRTKASKRQENLRYYWDRWLDLHSLLEIDGQYFDYYMNLREVVEIGLQTYQAYWLSALIPINWLKNLVVALIVTNIWLHPIISYKWKYHEGKRRLMLLVVDSLLDFFMSYFINLFILGFVLLSLLKFNARDGSMDFEAFFAPTTIATIYSTSKLVFIKGFGNFFSLTFQGAGLILSLEAIKKVLRRESDGLMLKAKPVVARAIYKPPSFCWRYVEKLHMIFYPYGLFFLIVHLSSLYRQNGTVEWRVDPCKSELKPWLATYRACASIEINCHRQGINGSEDELNKLLKEFDPDSVYRIQFNHCPSIGMPKIIQSFHDLFNIDTYNSSIARWSGDAALTGSHHPNIKMMHFIRVTGITELPEGLFSDDFPATIQTLFFIETDLTFLPENLDSKWPRSLSELYLESCKLSEIPIGLTNLQVHALNLFGNRIHQVPEQLLRDRHFWHLSFGGNKEIKLPHDVGTFFADHLDLRDTNLTQHTVPPWLDDTFFRNGRVFLGGTDFCLDESSNSTYSPDGGDPFVNSPVWTDGTSSMSWGKYKYDCGRVWTGNGRNSNPGLFRIKEYIQNYPS